MLVTACTSFQGAKPLVEWQSKWKVGRKESKHISESIKQVRHLPLKDLCKLSLCLHRELLSNFWPRELLSSMHSASYSISKPHQDFLLEWKKLKTSLRGIKILKSLSIKWVLQTNAIPASCWILNEARHRHDWAWSLVLLNSAWRKRVSSHWRSQPVPDKSFIKTEQSINVSACFKVTI